MNDSDARQRSNLWKIYLYRFFSDFWLIAPILIPFYESNGLNATQVFIVQATYGVSLLVFEIPSGYLSDIAGRKNTLVLGSVFLPIGLFIYAFSHTFNGFAVAEIILGIAGSLRSGTDSALIYDTLIQMERESEYKKFEGNAEFFHHTAHSVSSILGGLFALTSLRFPFYINIASALFLFPLAVSLVEPERKELRTENALMDVVKIARKCMTDNRIRALIIYSSLVTGSGITAVWSYYMYYEKLGLSVGLFGIIFAIYGLFTALGASQTHFIEGKIGERNSMYLLILISLVFIALGMVKTVFMICFILLNGFIWGFSGPLFTHHINRLIDSDIRATVLSVSNMFGSLSFIIIAPVFGRLVDDYSLSLAHFALGILFIVVAAVSLFLLHRNRVI